jgi:hypothetical protein
MSGKYADIRSWCADVELRVSAAARHRGAVLSQLDVGFDMSRRDQIELIGTRPPHHDRVLEIDPEECLRPGRGGGRPLPDRMETISDAVAGISDLEFGTPDATNQMAVNDAVRRSIEFGIPVLR